jgi:hypothetical protein
MGPVQILGALLCRDAGICQSNNIKLPAEVSSKFYTNWENKTNFTQHIYFLNPMKFSRYRQPRHDVKVFRHLVLPNHRHTLKTGT